MQQEHVGRRGRQKIVGSIEQAANVWFEVPAHPGLERQQSQDKS